PADLYPVRSARLCRAGAAGDGGLAARRADRAERVADLHSDLAGGCRVGAGGLASPAAPAARAAAPGRATAGLAPGGKPILTYTAWREQFCCQQIGRASCRERA